MRCSNVMDMVFVVDIWFEGLVGGMFFVIKFVLMWGFEERWYFWVMEYYVYYVLLNLK